jgi:murein DD-endopeptidase MepM/ murein hydrolase activator NlpD
MLRWVLVFLVGVLVGANAVYFAMTRDRTPPAAIAGSVEPAPAAATTAAATPAVAPSRPAPTPPAPAAPVASSPRAVAAAPQAAAVAPGATLGMPLPGLRPEQLDDTFDDARGTERRHEALDIMAPAGTPVLAVADGHIEKLFTSIPGGLTIYQFDPGLRHAYYYAHLQGYAPGLKENQAVKRGELIGYVGSTGNANPAAPHLHFAVFELGPERQWWRGTPVNPYPLLGGKPGPTTASR